MTNIRVLLADNHPIQSRGLALTLSETSDIRVVGEATDAGTAVDLVADLMPDVVLLDLDALDETGHMPFHRMRETAPDLSVIIMASDENDPMLMRALEAGASGYILKKTSVDGFLWAVRAAHRREAYILPRMMVRATAGSGRQPENGPAVPNGYQLLSPRERQLLPLIADGRSNEETAEMLQIMPRTVQTYRQRIMKKLDIHRQVGLMKYALQNGLIRI